MPGNSTFLKRSASQSARRSASKSFANAKRAPGLQYIRAVKTPPMMSSMPRATPQPKSILDQLLGIPSALEGITGKKR